MAVVAGPRLKPWWHKRLREVVDPLSLVPMDQLPYPPFELRADATTSCPSTDFFDGKILAAFLISTCAFVHPVTNRALSRAECIAIEADARVNGLQADAACVSAAFDLRSDDNKTGQCIARLKAMRSKADSVLVALHAEVSSTDIMVSEATGDGAALENEVDESAEESLPRRGRGRRGRRGGKRPQDEATASVQPAPPPPSPAALDDHPTPTDPLADALLTETDPHAMLSHLLGESCHEVAAYVCSLAADVAAVLCEEASDGTNADASNGSTLALEQLVELLAAHQTVNASEEQLVTIAQRLVAMPHLAMAPECRQTQPAVADLQQETQTRSPPQSARAKRAAAHAACGMPSTAGVGVGAGAGTARREPRAKTAPAADTLASGGEASRHSAESLVDLLIEFAPHVPRALCRFVLDGVYDGDAEAAIDTMLHVPLHELEVRMAEATHRELAREAKERMRAKLDKRRTLSKHSSVRDHLADGHSVFDLCKPRIAAYMASRKEAVCTPAIRYLDGAVVSHRGERYLADKAPAWDGGSRGRIVASQRAHHTPRTTQGAGSIAGGHAGDGKARGK